MMPTPTITAAASTAGGSHRTSGWVGTERTVAIRAIGAIATGPSSPGVRKRVGTLANAPMATVPTRRALGSWRRGPHGQS